MAKEIECRIGKARAVFNRLRTGQWSPREISIHTVYRVIVRPSLSYECQTWSLRVADERRLDVFDNVAMST